MNKRKCFKTAGAGVTGIVLLLNLGIAWAGESAADESEAGWISLFNGKNLDGWTVNGENPSSITAKDGKIVVKGPRTHAFYTGTVNDGTFKNFEFKAKVYITPGSNSGLYFHSKFQDKGWPNTGYEAQVNNTHKDNKKTGGLYAIQDVLNKSPVKDNKWFDYHIKVDGKQIIIKINGKQTVDYTEPDDLDRPKRQLSEGTFAIQAHDPKSHVEFKDLMVKMLP